MLVGDAQIELIEVEFRLTCENLPTGPLWEIWGTDGSCWRAEQDCGFQKGYRWVPMNVGAKTKLTPTGRMTDFYPKVGFAKAKVNAG